MDTTQVNYEKAEEILLEGRNISFQYSSGGFIIKNLNLQIRKGEIVGLVGPSGYGKSTLSKILAGYLKPGSGKVLWKGEDLPRKGYCPVQMIYQHPEKALNPRWRLKDSLCEGWIPSDELLDALCIKKELWMNRWPNELSGGELQRFCVARVLGPRTEFIIADEMTTMLDAITQAEIWQVLIKQVVDRQLGLLVITHNMALARRICSRIVDMQEINHLDRKEE